MSFNLHLRTPIILRCMVKQGTSFKIFRGSGFPEI